MTIRALIKSHPTVPKVPKPPGCTNNSDTTPCLNNTLIPSSTFVVSTTKEWVGPDMPAQSAYFDVEITTGYTGSYSDDILILGICNNLTSCNRAFADHNDANIRALYWSGVGTTAAIFNGIGPLVAGRYRFAVNRENAKLYAQRISGTPSVIVSVDISCFTETIRPFAGPQAGYATVKNGTFFGINLGSGGLY